jgi:hydroxyethylthiazole kinase-like uncharacterized protein yjeF
MAVELVTAARMREIEAAGMASGAVTGLELMERAGRGVVDAIAVEWPDLGPGSRAAVICGPGNNGGDGFVVARLLREAGWRVRVLAVPTLRRGPDAIEARRRWKRAGGRAEVLAFEAFHNDDQHGCGADLYVDALLGTGARGPFDGEIGRLMADWAGSGGDHGILRPRTVAIDIPSGLDADSGRIPGYPGDGASDPRGSPVPAARLTVTFDSPKLGHVLGLGPDLCGKVVVADIGLERFRASGPDDGGGGMIPMRTALVTGPARSSRSGPGPVPMAAVDDRRDDESRSAFRHLRKRQGHKYDHGHLLVLTGGVGRGGAARLAARAALRIGAGAVTLGCPPAALLENASRVDAIMTRRIDGPEGASDERYGAICVGPGFGTGDRQAEMLGAVLARTVPTVLDADALTLVAHHPDLRAAIHARCILTPHLGEFRRLFPDLAEALAGPRPSESPTRRETAADDAAEAMAPRDVTDTQRAPLPSKVDVTRQAAGALGAIVLLKGPDTVVVAPEGPAFVHDGTGDRAAPWLATAGSGDVLAGLIAGLAARGRMSAEDVAAAAWLHVEAARAFGPGLTADDLPDMIPGVLRGLEAPSG